MSTSRLLRRRHLVTHCQEKLAIYGRQCNSSIGSIGYFSTDDDSSSTSNAFDRSLKKQQRDNAALAQLRWRGGKDIVDYDYFRQEMAFRLVDRLDDIKRDEGFPLALDIGTC